MKCSGVEIGLKQVVSGRFWCYYCDEGEMMLNNHSLPDTMYFGSPKRISELKNKVFLTPYMGIASMFIIDKENLFPKGYQTSCNLSYRQWHSLNNLLLEPLKMVNIVHNITAFENDVFEGQSTGYIYVVDITDVKDRLTVFVTNNPDREVIYNGEEPLIITKHILHTLRWDLSYNSDEVKKHGVGVAQKITD
jgi:hypothetical protein